MILCTQDDKDFYLYKKDIDNKKVRFKIQVIFSKWWPIFIDNYKHLNIRQVVLDNVDKMINCKTGNLGFHIFKCIKCKFEDPVPDWLLDEFGGFSLINKKTVNIQLTVN